MIFTKLRFKNLLSTGNQFTEIDLNKYRTVLVIGENGSGKSTMLDALSFVLFGRPFRPDLNKPQLLNSINNKNLVVEVEFNIGTKEYKIVRGIKPALFEVYEDDRLLNQDANVRDYQDYLEKNILRCTHRAFIQVVILGSANFTPFMQLPAQFRREVVESLLDLQIFSIMNSILATKKQQNESSIAQNVSEKKLITQRMELMKEHTAQIQQNNQKIIDDKKDRIESAKCDIDQAKKDIVQIHHSIVDFEKLIIDYDNKLNLQIELGQIKFKLEHKISNLAKGIDFFHNNETCPTCTQEIDPEFKCDIIIKKKLASDEASDALIKVKEKIEKVNNRLSEIKKVKDHITDLEIDLDHKESTITQLQKYVIELESEVNTIELHNKAIDNSELVKINAQLADVSIQYNALISRKNLLELAGIMLKDSGIKARIIKQYVPIINKLVNKYLSLLDFFVNFSLNERFEEKILSRYRDEFTYGSFSEGEKFRINIALLFTWRAIAKLRNSINTNVLFLDEIFDSSLDLPGTEEFLKLIGQTEAENIFLISPKAGDNLFDKFNNTIRFVKRSNFSHLENV